MSKDKEVDEANLNRKDTIKLVKERVKIEREEKKNDVKSIVELDAVDREIANLLIEYPSLPKTKIAEIVGIARKTLYVRMAKPAFQKLMREWYMPEEGLKKEIKNDALRRLRKIIKLGADEVALRACQFILSADYDKSTLEISGVQERIYKVQFGDGGQLYQEVIDVKADVEKRMQSTNAIDMLKALPENQKAAATGTDGQNVEKKAKPVKKEEKKEPPKEPKKRGRPPGPPKEKPKKEPKPRGRKPIQPITKDIDI